MDANIGLPIKNPSAAAPKRRQRYLRFKLQPGDEALLSQLSHEHQQALNSQGTYRERAEQMGVALGTVRSRLHRARARLEELRKPGESTDLSDTPH